MLPSYFFEENIPVAKSYFEVTVPKNVDIRFVVRGANADKVQRTRVENKKTVTYTFSVTDLPALKAYDGEPSSSWHSLQVVPYIASYQLQGEEPTKMLSDPEHLYAYFYKFISNVNTGKDEEIAQLAATITKGDLTQRQKAMHIYEWVQANIHYVAFEDSLGGFIPRPAGLVCKRKFGDCKDMTSALVALCREAGIEAHYTWIGTRSLPYSYEETPVTKVANHMICTIKLDGEWLFLDGTHSLIPFGCVPQSIQDKEALISISEKEFRIVKVPVADVTNNVIVDTTQLEIKGGVIAGSAALHLKGYSSWEVQLLMQYKKNEARDIYVRNIMIRGSNKYDQKGYTYSASDTGDKTSRFTADFTIPDLLKKAGKEYYLNMNMDREKEYIDTAGRNVPFYFLYRNTDREVVILTVPDGYTVSYVPPAIEGNIDNHWSYKVKYSMVGNKVILEKEFSNLSLSIPPSDFVAYNKAMDELKKHFKESVVLKSN
jgi:transglutaminase-like putative cysteine protease